MATVLASFIGSLTTVNPGAEPQNAEAHRQLVFFINSLQMPQMKKPPPMWKMRSMTTLTPHYTEDVSYSIPQLASAQAGAELEDRINLLSLLTSIFPQEWENFTERTEITGSDVVGKADQASLVTWSSNRGQTLSRTIKGVCKNAEAIRLLGKLEGIQDETELDQLVLAKFEFLATCQKYGDFCKSSSERDIWHKKSIDDLMEKYPNELRVAYVDASDDGTEYYSVLCGYDARKKQVRTLYRVKLPGNPIIGEGKPENQNHAIIFCKGQYLQTLDMNQDHYMGEAFKVRNLLEGFEGNTRIIGFREHIFSASTGAVAQFAASNEFVFGTLVQRFMTGLGVRFHYGHPDVWDKVWVQTNGGVSKASKTLHISEDIFGGFNVLLRGGAVDFVEFIHCGKGRDMTFLATNGFETKIAGGNAMQLLSRDVLRLAKALDLSRLMSMFFSGHGTYMNTWLVMQAIRWFIIVNLILLLAGVEFSDEYMWNSSPEAAAFRANHMGHRQLSTLALNSTNLTGLNSTLLLCQATGRADCGTGQAGPGGLYGAATQVVNTEDPLLTSDYTLAVWRAGTFSSMYVVQLGFAMMVPLFLETWLETSLVTGLMTVLKATTLGLMYYIFSTQTKAYHFAHGLTFGRASYIATGRGYDMETHSLVQIYTIYVSSHLYSALELLMLAAIYSVFQTEGTVLALTTWSTWVYAGSLLLSPWLYLSHGTTLQELLRSLKEMLAWAGDNAVRPDEGEGSWTKFHRKRQTATRALGKSAKLFMLGGEALASILLTYGCLSAVRLNHPYNLVHPLGGLNTVEYFVLDSGRDWQTKYAIFVLSLIVLFAISLLYFAVFTIARRTRIGECFEAMGWGVHLFVGLFVAFVVGAVWVFALDIVLAMLVSCNVASLQLDPYTSPAYALSLGGCGATAANTAATTAQPVLHFLGSSAGLASDPNRSHHEGAYNAVLLLFITLYVFIYIVRVLASVDYAPVATQSAKRKPWESGFPRAGAPNSSSDTTTDSKDSNPLLSSPPPSPPPSPPAKNGKPANTSFAKLATPQLVGGVELGAVPTPEPTVLEDSVPPTRASTDDVGEGSTTLRAITRPSHRRNRKDCLCCSAAQLFHCLGFQAYSDLFYRHFDVLVAVIITTLLLILALLPMKVLRMALVYNQGFASTVLRVAQRRRHFLNELLQR